MTHSGQSTALQGQLRRGGALDPHGLDIEAVVNTAYELGLALLVANCDPARSRSAVLRAIVKAVDFPEYFGGNLDALFDCLCDTVLDQKVGVVLWLYRLHSGDPSLEEDARRIATVCSDAALFAQRNGRVFSYVIEHAGKHSDPVLTKAVMPAS
jgi:RNAse (barnase) inhibitor barstar